jgi:hypothetical protein
MGREGLVLRGAIPTYPAMDTNKPPMRCCEKRYDADYLKRKEGILHAWRAWRNSIVKAMAALIEQERDGGEEMMMLHHELQQCDTTWIALTEPWHLQEIAPTAANEPEDG